MLAGGEGVGEQEGVAEHVFECLADGVVGVGQHRGGCVGHDAGEQDGRIRSGSGLVEPVDDGGPAVEGATEQVEADGLVGPATGELLGAQQPAVADRCGVPARQPEHAGEVAGDFACPGGPVRSAGVVVGQRHRDRVSFGGQPQGRGVGDA
ncbi:hypothetical protein BCD48_42645 [Pseudofrankia sp. BMG5.36]|nr:hypothetical protein BCD48_42645 [Pseudofrankia sp. BMG5.36]